MPAFDSNADAVARGDRTVDMCSQGLVPVGLVAKPRPRVSPVTSAGLSFTA